jgi:hypothetical protein
MDGNKFLTIISTHKCPILKINDKEKKNISIDDVNFKIFKYLFENSNTKIICYTNTNILIVVKYFIYIDDADNEIKIYNSLKQKHLLHLFIPCYFIENTKHKILVMTKGNNVNINYIKSSFSNFIQFIKRIVYIINKLSKNNIYYTDLKMENILTQNNEYYLIDFGSIIFANNQGISTYIHKKHLIKDDRGFFEYNEIQNHLSFIIWLLFGQIFCDADYIGDTFRYDRTNDMIIQYNSRVNFIFKKINSKLSNLLKNYTNSYILINIKQFLNKMYNQKTTLDEIESFFIDINTYC